MSPSVSVRLLLTQSDARLVEYARAGHERAFEALVRRYRRQLHGYCRRLLLSDERAEDALQQALLQAWMALRDGAEVRDARAWLYRVVHNAAINALRVSGYDYCRLNESLSGTDAPQADLDRRIAVREALAGLAALPQMQREALLRTAVEGRSHQQVANDLGVSEPAVRGLVHRARTALRAAAGAIVPPPLLEWALEAGTRGTPMLERVAGLGAGGGSAGFAGLLVKGSAVAVTAGALAGGIVATHSHRREARVVVHTSARAGGSARGGAGKPSGADASVRQAAFTQPSAGEHRTAIVGDRRSTRSAGQPDGGALPPRVRRPRSSAPAPSWTGPGPAGHPHRDGGGQQGEAPGPTSGARDGGGSGGATSHNDHGESSDASRPGSGEGQQREGGGENTGRDGGASSDESGKDGSGSTGGQASGGGVEPGSSVSSGASGGSGSPPSESTPGGDTPTDTSETNSFKDESSLPGKAPPQSD